MKTYATRPPFETTETHERAMAHLRCPVDGCNETSSKVAERLLAVVPNEPSTCPHCFEILTVKGVDVTTGSVMMMCGECQRVVRKLPSPALHDKTLSSRERRGK